MVTHKESAIGSPPQLRPSEISLLQKEGCTTGEGVWTVEIWATNLFDKTTKNVTFNTPLRSGTAPVSTSRGTFVEAPRLYGATLRMQF